VVLRVEVLNPVHVSGEGMGDTTTPEAKFGDKLTFGRAGDGPHSHRAILVRAWFRCRYPCTDAGNR
jgi:hypothetical protein